VGQWLRLNLGSVKRVSHITLAVYNGSSRRNVFDLQVSNDGTTWKTVFSGTSAGTSTAQQQIDFPDVDARYVRYFGRGNYSTGGVFSPWNSLTEVDVFGP
jgi:hypothetical protein